MAGIRKIRLNSELKGSDKEDKRGISEIKHLFCDEGEGFFTPFRRKPVILFWQAYKRLWYISEESRQDKIDEQHHRNNYHVYTDKFFF